MKSKAIVSLLLSAVLLLGLPVSAYAEENTAESAAEENVTEENAAEESETEETVEPGVQVDPENAAEEDMASVSSEVYTWYLYSLEDSFEMPLYFVNDVNDLPYVNLSDWVDMLVTVNQLVLEDEGYGVSLETDGEIAMLTRENDFSMLIDFDEGTIMFDDYDFFVHSSGEKSLLDIVASDAVDEEGNPLLFNRIQKGSFDRYGKELDLPLYDYDIQLFWSAEDGLYLVPLQTLNDFLISPVCLSSILFDGKAVYLTNKNSLIQDGELTEMGNEYMYAPVEEMSEELAWYNYCELCLALDHLYGLKEIHDITSFDAIFRETGYRPYLASTDPNVSDGALYDFINYYLDDMHSGFNIASYRTDEAEVSTVDSLSVRLSDLDGQIYGGARSHADHPIPTYEEVGNTAYITFDEFLMGKSPIQYYEEGYEHAEDPADPYGDTVGLIMYANEQIQREGSPIENVVIDLSVNGGGELDAAAFVAAWYLGEADLSVRSSLTGAVSTGIYQADVNLDKVFDEKDTVADKNLYCIISPYSFSCGNLIPNIFKASHKVTLLGQTSGGGSCTILPMSNAIGSMFQVSSPYRMSYRKNGSYYDTDTGIDPDVQIVKPENIYNRQALTDYINQLF